MIAAFSPTPVARLRAAPAVRLGLWPTLAACCAAALALRLSFRIGYAEEIDSIRFLLALDRFDVAAYQPHFPGYPIFVLLGRAFLAVLGEPVAALATLCAVCGALLPIPVALLARETLGEREARWAALLCAVNPLVWLHAQMLLSDVPGLLFLFSGLAALAASLRTGSARLTYVGCFVLGLTLGVRLSYFPFALSALGLAAWRLRLRVGPAAALLGGVAVWALPLVAMTGWGPLVEVARLQGSGHFERWGGSIVTDSSLGHRGVMFAWELVAQGLGTWWTDRSATYLVPTLGLLALAAIVALRWQRPRRDRLAFWLALAGPYAAWAFLGQNIVVKARHVLPIVVLMTLLVAWAIQRGLEASGPRSRAVVALAAALVVTGQALSGLALVREHRDAPSNAVVLSRALAARCSAAPDRQVLAYTATLERHLAREAPCVVAVKVRRLSEARRDLAERSWLGEAYVLSDVTHAERAGKVPWLRASRDRYIQNALSELSLYELTGGHHGR